MGVTTTTQIFAGVCERPPPLENGAIECDDGDLTLGKACHFRCREGYKLQGASIRRCSHDYQWSGKVRCDPLPVNTNSEPADDTRSFSQNNNAPSLHDFERKSYPSSEVISNDPCQNLSCEQLCLLKEGKHQCRCCAGYLINDDKKTCKLNNASRVNMNDCLQQYKKVGDVQFRPCPTGYTFDYHINGCLENLPRKTVIPAPRPVSSSESCSLRNGGCEHDCFKRTSGTIVCKCRNGFDLHPDGKRCNDIDECRTNNFDCSHSCRNVNGGAFCTCPHGLKLDFDRKTCIDVDECLQGSRCQHYCNNTHGSFFCSCRPGYILLEGYICTGCKRNSYWSYESNACVDCPKYSHTDSEGKTSIKDCVCDLGYRGSPGNYITCEDIDECSTNNFGCSDDCVNTPGGAYCICPKGFMLDTDSKTCIDIDECSIKNGGCEGLCINTKGSFRCMCREGFVLSRKDDYACDDIDECAENNGGCEHLCINYRGGFYCACEEGYLLDSTLKNCTDIQCSKPPLPHYSYMDCKYRNNSLNETTSFPVGTTCIFRCMKGFKNAADDNKLKCRTDGTWKGILPECKPESCPRLAVPENGKIHPPSCYKHGATVKQKCTFSCHTGYILQGPAVFQCKNNLSWNNKDIPICNLVQIEPFIKCPEDIGVVLLQGKASHNITVPEPTTNMEHYQVHPSSINVNETNIFTVGETQITFTAISPFNETAQCVMTVTVLDEEPPVFQFCPDPILIEGAKSSGEFVTWNEPVVTDNVELVYVFSLLEPNATLSPGTYFVEYVAKDSSGNIATCSFDISIIRMNCTDLKDPTHGKSNCMDWMFGKLCNPECEDGYMRDPDDPVYYSCDDTGVWEPSESISECLRYTPTTTSTCQDGFELQVDAVGEEICIECPSNTIWSSLTGKCENDLKE